MDASVLISVKTCMYQRSTVWAVLPLLQGIRNITGLIITVNSVVYLVGKAMGHSSDSETLNL